MKKKKIIASLFIKNGKAVTDFSGKTSFTNLSPVELSEAYDHAGADELFVFDLSTEDGEHEECFNLLRSIQRCIDIPMAGFGHIVRAEDVKKFLYAGCKKVFLNFSKENNQLLLEEVSKRFGKEKIGVCLGNETSYQENQNLIETYASSLVLFPEALGVLKEKTELETILVDLKKQPAELLKSLKQPNVTGICLKPASKGEEPFFMIKEQAKTEEICVNTFESPVKWEDFRLNSDGLLPVVVQDYKNLEVLMVAYMNKEAFEQTIRTGQMTYYSRSRKELWVKGLTSGHFQYVKKLSMDCDQDTLLAKVFQVGAACHTGNRSCFYQTLVEKESIHENPLQIFEKVFAVIEDRKQHPKEGSYTNYLFDKGIDKILKKVGEEATEIIIAAKNPNPEEIKYEIADFLYHCMVLMAERGVTWEDITEELAQR